MGNWRLRLHRARRRLVEFYDSIWFYPVVLAVAALGLFWFTTEVDQGRWLGDFLDRRDSPWWVTYFLFAGDAAHQEAAARTIREFVGLRA